MSVSVLFLFIISRMTLVYWVDVVVCLVLLVVIGYFFCLFVIFLLTFKLLYSLWDVVVVFFCVLAAAKRTASYTHFNSTCQPCYLTNCVTLTCSNKLDNNNNNNNNYNDNYYYYYYYEHIKVYFRIYLLWYFIWSIYLQRPSCRCCEKVLKCNL